MDIIPDYSKLPDHEYVTWLSCDDDLWFVLRLKWEEKQEEIKMSYERYRSVIMNEFNGGKYISHHSLSLTLYLLSLTDYLCLSLSLYSTLVSEADALARIEVEEMFSGAKRIQKNPKKYKEYTDFYRTILTTAFIVYWVI